MGLIAPRESMLERTIAVLLILALVAHAQSASAHDEPCTVTDGKDPCGPGEICTDQSGTLGTCVPIPCSTDVDCSAAAPRTLCDVATSPSECVECRTDVDCGGSRRCEKDSRTGRRGLCAECVLGDRDGCATSPGGSKCQIITGTCGCDTSADCRQPSFTCSATNVCVDPDAGAPAPEDSGLPARADAGVADTAVTKHEAPSRLATEGRGCAAGGSEHAGSRFGARALWLCVAGLFAARRRADAPRRRHRRAR